MAAGHQHFITICIPITLDQKWRIVREHEINNMIDLLGNPARSDIEQRLSATKIVHFLSISVIASEESTDPSYLVIETVADEKPERAIPKIAEAIGDDLFTLVRHACGFDKRKNLAHYLLKHNYSLERSFPWRFLRRTIGLPFNGIPGETVENILFHKKIADAAREKIASINSGRPSVEQTPYSYLLNVRETVFNPESADRLKADDKKPTLIKSALSLFEGPAPLSFVDRADAPWVKNRQEGRKISALSALSLFPGQILAITAAFWLMAILVDSENREWLIHFFKLMKYYFFDIPLCLGGKILSPEPALQLSKCFENGLVGEIKLLVLDIVRMAVLSVRSMWFALFTLLFTVLLLRSNLRSLERKNTPIDRDPDPAIIREIMARENQPGFVQNHMISVTEIQNSWLRRMIWLPLAARVVAAAVDKGLFRTGFLANVGTVHLARWVALPKTRKWVFFSNYDGSWESYLEDFITKSNMGVNAMWSSTEGFPKTEHLFWGGSTDGDRFKRFARRSMIPTRFWYSAYPELTAEEIRKNALISDGLRKITTAAEADAWLDLFGSIPRPAYAIETDQVQNFVFGGLKHLRKAHCIAVRFPEEAHVDNHAWVEAIRPHICFGEKKPGNSAMYVAFSATGLAKLGLEDEVDKSEALDAPAQETAKKRNVTKFPAAFSLGMNDVSRKRVLEDTGDNCEKKWAWGNKDNPVDAVLLLFANNDDPGAMIKKLKAREIKRLSAFNIACAYEIELRLDTNDDGYVKEPFGFADGVSQPRIRGYDVATSDSDAIHAVEPGEFILGYRDNRNFYPPTPQITAAKDPKNILHGPPNAIPLRWPDFQSEDKAKYATRDFGRNGTYLVIRQLAQDVNGFEEYIENTSVQLQCTAGNEYKTPEWVGAKMMGRWRNGASFVKHPYKPGDNAPDNDFLFARDDPQGVKCPFGAHIRRANPRDSLDPESDKELSVSNRHRILRRGRTYAINNEDEQEVGLFFMCLNNDIERQFEFVQQNWIASKSFHGLVDERDPISSHAPGERSFTIADAKGPEKVPSFKSFVTVRGGGYFFMPGKRALKYLATYSPQ